MLPRFIFDSDDLEMYFTSTELLPFAFPPFPLERDVNPVEIDSRAAFGGSRGVRSRRRRNRTSIYDRSVAPDAHSFTLGDSRYHFYRGEIQGIDRVTSRARLQRLKRRRYSTRLALRFHSVL